MRQTRVGRDSGSGPIGQTVYRGGVQPSQVKRVRFALDLTSTEGACKGAAAVSWGSAGSSDGRLLLKPALDLAMAMDVSPTRAAGGGRGRRGRGRSGEGFSDVFTYNYIGECHDDPAEP